MNLTFPVLKGGDSGPRGLGFPVSLTIASLRYARGGLTPSPQALTASPAARMTFAALTSRSWTAPHPAHVHSRTPSGIVVAITPHAEHVLDDGQNRSIAITVRPYHPALYSSMARNCAQLASEMARAREWLRTMLRTGRSSMITVWFSRIILVDSLCR